RISVFSQIQDAHPSIPAAHPTALVKNDRLRVYRNVRSQIHSSAPPQAIQNLLRRSRWSLLLLFFRKVRGRTPPWLASPPPFDLLRVQLPSPDSHVFF